MSYKKKSTKTLTALSEEVDAYLGESAGRFIISINSSKLYSIYDQFLRIDVSEFLLAEHVLPKIKNYLNDLSKNPEKIFGTREYFFQLCKKEEYIFDMRCWKRPRNKITYSDVYAWIRNGCVPANCGHLTYTLEKVLQSKTVTIHEAVLAILQNKNVQMEEELGSCFVEPLESNSDYMFFSVVSGSTVIKKMFDEFDSLIYLMLL